MPLKIKSVSGSVTLDAQNVSGDQTLTVPSLSGGKTLLTTDGDGSSLTGVGVDGIVSSANATAIKINASEFVGVGGDFDAKKQLHIQNNSSDCMIILDTAGVSTDKIIAFCQEYGNGGTGSHYWSLGVDASEQDFVLAYDASSQASVGSDRLLAVTSDGRGLSQFTAKAWCNFDGTGSASSWEKDSHNVSSYNDDGTGNYRIHFANSLASRDFACAVTDDDYGSLARSYSDSSGSYVRLYAYDHGGSGTDTIVNCIIFGD